MVDLRVEQITIWDRHCADSEISIRNNQYSKGKTTRVKKSYRSSTFFLKSNFVSSHFNKLLHLIDHIRVTVTQDFRYRCLDNVLYCSLSFTFTHFLLNIQNQKGKNKVKYHYLSGYLQIHTSTMTFMPRRAYLLESTRWLIV